MVSVILEYLDITKNLRTENNKKLLISTVKPHNDVSSQIIGHWIKSLLKLALTQNSSRTVHDTQQYQQHLKME